jgi:hypothetical protein
MGIVHRTLESGLVSAEIGMDGVALERELKKRDPLLSLQGWPSQTHGCVLYKVVRYAGPDRPPDLICVWQSERGEPYPLSSGLLDLVDRLDRNNRVPYADEDELNARRAQERRKQTDRDNEGIEDNWLFKHGRPVLPRSQSLRMSRDKRRNRGEKV